MVKAVLAVLAISSVLACSGCGLWYGKAPVGKAPVVAKY